MNTKGIDTLWMVGLVGGLKCLLFYSQNADCGEQIFEEMMKFVLNIEFKVLTGYANRAGWPMATNLIWGI